jgi:hypothetical protein
MLDPSGAERVENVVHAALDYLGEKGWVHALAYYDRLGRGAFGVSAKQDGETFGESLLGYLPEQDIRPGELPGLSDEHFVNLRGAVADYEPATQCVGIVVGHFELTEVTVWSVFDLPARH